MRFWATHDCVGEEADRLLEVSTLLEILDVTEEIDECVDSCVQRFNPS